MSGSLSTALLLLVLVYGAASQPSVSIDTTHIIHEVRSHYLSVSIDTAQLVGSHFWSTPQQPFNFSRPRLINLAKSLAPAVLRVGGTTGDKVYYDLSDSPLSEPPGKYKYIMTREEYDNLNAFVQEVGFQLVFGLNLGPGARESGDITSWNSTNAEQLLKYTQQKQYPVLGFELGNEPNLFMLAFGPRYYLHPDQLAAAFTQLSPLMNSINPNWKLVGPDVSFEYPIVGQLVPDFWQNFVQAMNQSGVTLDMATYHWYPLWSERCLGPLPDPFVATPEKYLHPETYNKVIHHANVVQESIRQYQPAAEIWVGESAGSLCGGQPGVADRFIDSLWWVDQLGLLMQSENTAGQVRQTLAGSSYGLLNEWTLDPRPDYFASLAWKQLMGNQVLNTTVFNSTHIRAYAHCAASQYPRGSVTLQLINLHQNMTNVTLPSSMGTSVLAFRFTPPEPLEITSPFVALNGEVLRVDGEGHPPVLSGVTISLESGMVALPPNSYTYLVTSPFPNACQ